MRYAAVVLWFLFTGPAFAGLREDVILPTVEVRGATGFGSGVVLKVAGEVLILTASHVVAEAVSEPAEVSRTRAVDGAETVVMQRRFGSLWIHAGRLNVRADVVAYSPREEDGNDDLAILRPADAEGLTAAELGTDPRVQAGDECWYCGSAGGIFRSLEKSVINRTDFAALGKRFLLVNGNGCPGCSGCGIFAKREGRYRLAGVLVRGARGDARTPCMCQTRATIDKFLKDYVQAREEDE